MSEIYMVLELSEEERNKFEENVDNFIAFTSFAKGFSSEKRAMEQFKKSKNNFLFRIMIPKNKIGNRRSIVNVVHFVCFMV